MTPSNTWPLDAPFMDESMTRSTLEEARVMTVQRVVAMDDLPATFTGFILFTASWTGEAGESVAQVFEGLAMTLSSAERRFVTVEESESTDGLFERFAVEAVPTVLAVRGGRAMGRVVGVSAAEVISLVERADLQTRETGEEMPGTREPAVAPVDEKIALKKQLEMLIGSAPLMLFIKGTPEAPQCGFTGQLLRLLATHGLHPHAHYRTFDILADPVVRQGLKDHSHWPTYPQIYWRGELVGGLDILKEMSATGQLDEIVSALKTDRS